MRNLFALCANVGRVVTILIGYALLALNAQAASFGLFDSYASSGAFFFSFNTVPGESYNIEYQSDVSSPSWQLLTAPPVATGAKITIADSSTAGPKRFYRVRANGSGTYSTNAVGYANVSMLPGLNVMANPLRRSAENRLNDVLPYAPDFTEILKVAGPYFDIADFFAPDGWTDGGGLSPLTLSPGEGALLYAEEAFTATFVGDVMEGSLTNKLPAGLSLCSSIVPRAGAITSVLGFPAGEGDKLYQFDRNSQSYHTSRYSNGSWLPSEPVIAIGEAFWIELGTARNWVTQFSIGGGGAYAITNLAYTGERTGIVPVNAPVLTIACSGSGATVAWSPSAAGFMLQTSTDALSWMDAPAATSPYTFPTAFGNMFFRLRGPSGYSSNVVGFINLPISPAWNLAGNPLLPSRIVEDLFPAPPNFMEVCKVGGPTFTCADYDPGFSFWFSDTPIPFSPGEGMVIYAQAPFTATFCGEVAQGALTNRLPAGLSLCSSIVPRAGPVTTVLGFPAEEGDMLYQLNKATQSYRTNTYLNGNWQPSEPVIFVGEAFWVELGRAKDWVTYFTTDGGGSTGSYFVSNAPHTGSKTFPVPNPVPPLIIAQPQSRTNALGTDAAFMVGVLGSPIVRYQWWSNGVAVAQATNSSITISNVKATTGTNYFVVASNDYGSVTSGIAKLTLVAPPTITAQPQGTTVIAGQPASFSVTASGTLPLSYQWYFSNAAIGGATSSNYSIAIAQVSNQGIYRVRVSNAAGNVDSSNATLTVIVPPPCITVLADQSTYSMGAAIPLHLQSFDCTSSTPLPNKPATVYIRTAGTTRTFAATTDGTGNATVIFQPLAGEAGFYEIAAASPDELNPATQDNFRIAGVSFGTASLKKRLAVGIAATNTLDLQNLTDLPLSGLSASLVGVPGTVTFQPTTLGPNASNRFEAVLEVTGAVTSSPVLLRITSAEGTTNDISLDVTVAPPVAQLAISPSSLHAPMLQGTQSVVTFFVTNIGGAFSGDLEILLPEPLPPWLNLASPSILPSLAPDGSALVMLYLTPSETLPTGPYFGAIRLWNSALGQIDVPFQFDCVSTLVGGLKVTVEDEFTYYAVGAPRVTNALVTLLNPYFRTNITSALTDNEGNVLFTGLPAGYYEVFVQAGQHGSFDSYGLVVGNQTNTVTAFLARQMVSYRWIVTTQAIDDRYIFTLDTRFQTEVPAPVIYIAPGAFDLCNFSAASNYVMLTIVNSGLIAAKSAALTFGSHPNYRIVPLTPNIGDIPAQSSRQVPVVIYHIGSTDGPSQIEAHLDWMLLTGAEPRFYRLDIPIYNAGLHDCEPGSVGSPPMPPAPGPVGAGPFGSAPTERSGEPVGTTPGNPIISSPPIFSTQPPGVLSVEAGVQLSQTAVMVRSVFEALLEIDNGSVDPLSNLSVVIDIRNTNGVPSNDRFGIRPPQLIGLNSIDGTGLLPPHASGQSKWILIPATNAAPTDPTRYTVGGTISYQQAGHAVQIPLFPIPITVFPDAQLVVDYFWEEIAYSDDPFTADVEPPIPFGVGLRMKNVGFGQATAVRISSAQPQIVDNESGLAINFQLLSAQVNTQAVTSSLNVLMGDIAPGASSVVTWWMTASLQGRFVNYTASFEHLDDLGKKNLSLVDSVAIHPMVHVVRVDFPTDDGAPDYLANDSYNPDHLADHLYFSGGTAANVTSVTNGLIDGPPGPGHINVRLILTNSVPAGWVYIRIPDPNPGTSVLRAVGRSDGRELLVETNVWATHRIVHPTNADPYREDFLHLLDYGSTGSYTLYYDIAPVRPAITNQPVSRTNAVGTTATFSVAASGTSPLSYQWFKDGVPLLSGIGPALAIDPVGTNDAGIYTVRVSNAAGATNSLDARLAVRTPPSIDPVSDQFVIVGRQLVVTNRGVAQDIAGPLFFRIDSSAPAGATISADGIFKWTPVCSQGSSTNVIRVWAIDSGTLQLSNSITFRITVPECVEAALGNTIVQTGHTSSVPVRLVSTVALTNMSFTIPFPTDRFTNFGMAVNSPQVVTQSVRLLSAGQLQVTFTLSSNSVLHGPTNVGQLAFSLLPDQPSAFVFLPITDVQGLKPDGQIVANAYGQPGRIVVIGREPLLEAWLDTNSEPLLTLYGNPGITYTVQTSLDLVPAGWSNVFNMTLTSLFQSTNWINGGESTRFFRAFGPP